MPELMTDERLKQIQNLTRYSIEHWQEIMSALKAEREARKKAEKLLAKAAFELDNETCSPTTWEIAEFLGLELPANYTPMRNFLREKAEEQG